MTPTAMFLLFLSGLALGGLLVFVILWLWLVATMTKSK